MDVKVSCLLVVAVLVCSAYSKRNVKLNNAPFKACDGGKNAKLIKVSTDANIQNNEVELVKGTNVTMYFEFEMETSSKTAISKVYGKLGPLPKVPFTPPNPNACLNSNLTCPLQPKHTYTYVDAIPVLSEYPKLRLEVIWELTVDGSADPKTDIWCAVIPAQIADK